MHLEEYVSDLDEFVKFKLTEFISKYYLQSENPEIIQGCSLKEFMENELEKVTFKVENAYITNSDESLNGVLNFKVHLTMGDESYSTYLTIDKNILQRK